MFAQLLEIPFDFLTRIARYDIDMLGLAVLLILTAATEIGFRIGRMALLRRRTQFLQLRHRQHARPVRVPAGGGVLHGILAL